MSRLLPLVLALILSALASAAVVRAEGAALAMGAEPSPEIRMSAAMTDCERCGSDRLLLADEQCGTPCGPTLGVGSARPVISLRGVRIAWSGSPGRPTGRAAAPEPHPPRVHSS